MKLTGTSPIVPVFGPFVWKSHFRCLVGPRLILHLLPNTADLVCFTDVLIYIFVRRIVFFPKFEVSFGLFIPSLSISIRVYKADMFECRI